MPKNDSAPTTYLGARVPVELARAFERVAKHEDRTVSAELRRVVRQHVEEVLGEGQIPVVEPRAA
jgi:hypothetical protein